MYLNFIILVVKLKLCFNFQYSEYYEYKSMKICNNSKYVASCKVRFCVFYLQRKGEKCLPPSIWVKLTLWQAKWVILRGLGWIVGVRETIAENLLPL